MSVLKRIRTIGLGIVTLGCTESFDAVAPPDAYGPYGVSYTSFTAVDTRTSIDSGE